VKTLVLCIVVLAAALVALGFWRGWFEVGSTKEDGKVHADLEANLKKFKADKEAFKKSLGEKSRAMKDKIADLKNKAKELTGAAKAKAEQEIDALSKRHTTIEKKMNEVDESSEETFKDLKNSLKGEIEEGAAAGKEKEATQSK
jgi:hypothetical protein